MDSENSIQCVYSWLSTTSPSLSVLLSETHCLWGPVGLLLGVCGVLPPCPTPHFFNLLTSIHSALDLTSDILLGPPHSPVPPLSHNPNYTFQHASETHPFKHILDSFLWTSLFQKYYSQGLWFLWLQRVD